MKNLELALNKAGYTDDMAIYANAKQIENKIWFVCIDTSEAASTECFTLSYFDLIKGDYAAEPLIWETTFLQAMRRFNAL